MASRCNQEILENYFSQSLGLGRFYNHPFLTAAIQTVKSLIMNRIASVTFNNDNSVVEKEIHTLNAD